MTTLHDTTNGSAMDVHRLLDEAFAGVDMTPDRQDLKEEIHANLVARVAEPQAEGVNGGAAARRAFEDLGDIRAIVDGAEPAAAGGTAALSRRHRVRPRPAFVVRTVLQSALGAAALAVLALAATTGDVPVGAEAGAAFVVAAAAGTVTADALRQETTTNNPMPTGRAAGYGLGVLLAVAGLGGGWLYLRGNSLGWAVGAGVSLLVAAGLLSYLGATQSNRHKAWMLRMEESHAAVGDRFAEDPAAARFGVYTLVNWLIALAAFVVLTLTVGWAWSWLAIVGGLAVMMILIARMLFAPTS